MGEWASQESRPTPDLHAALGDAAWLTGLERNADVVIMEAYAPLLVNVNSGASIWPTNLIGYDALRSYGSPSYYLQVMFDWLRGDVVLPTKLTTSGASLLYQSVTRDSQDGTVYLKLVNLAGEVQPLHVDLNGAQGIAKIGRAVMLTGSPQDTNSLSNPYKVVPTTARVSGLGQSFDYSLPPYSITVLKLGVAEKHHEEELVRRILLSCGVRQPSKRPSRVQECQARVCDQQRLGFLDHRTGGLYQSFSGPWQRVRRIQDSRGRHAPCRAHDAADARFVC